MRELLKKRERENVKFFILMLVAISLFFFAVFYPPQFYIFDLPKDSDRLEKAIISFCGFFLFFYSFSKLNYSNEISVEDLKIIQEDKDYENFKYFYKKNMKGYTYKLHYGTFYIGIRKYDQYLEDEKNEDKIIKKQFLKEIMDNH
ncbi:hypothetical protein ACOL3H_07165 [Aliarcobacter butzleri]